jgi:uncharacterized protein
MGIITRRRVGILAPLGVLVVVLTAWHVGTIATSPQASVVGPPPADLRAETITIDSASGSRLASWFVPGKSGAGAVLLLQGVRGTRLELVERARFFHRSGFAVLMIDFQGTGESPGRAITFGYLESRDVRAAFDYLVKRLPNERIGLVGMSLGGAATILSDPPIPADAMVLEAVFATFDDALVNRLKLYFGKLGPLLKAGLSLQIKPRLGFWMADLEPAAKIHRLKSRLLLIAGGADKLASMTEMQLLFDRATAPKQLWVIPGAGHLDFHWHYKEAYEVRILAFLRPLLSLQ